MHGPEIDGLDVAALTRMEMDHRKFIWKNIQKTRQTPGYEKVYLVETAPQLGVAHHPRVVRTEEDHPRRSQGRHAVPRRGWRGRVRQRRARRVADPLRGLGAGEGRESPGRRAVRGRRAEHGRPGAADPQLFRHRVMPPARAAAVAVQDGCRVRDVEIAKVQKVLKQQEAYLG